MLVIQLSLFPDVAAVIFSNRIKEALSFSQTWVTDFLAHHKTAAHIWVLLWLPRYEISRKPFVLLFQGKDEVCRVAVRSGNRRSWANWCWPRGQSINLRLWRVIIWYDFFLFYTRVLDFQCNLFSATIIAYCKRL